ncbi:hypothetical protein UFOVP1311_25 [uncultured Caudovirales phage]|uniref:DUF6948 domain-containing protein n=1 Tax=uncultured Caudovirales phage TaxID=2100421 RepID=A0A6J5RJA4_9CAUD|nr:hypothetical protein UFOVP1311_25 [uncultured Caudovirales phage]
MDLNTLKEIISILDKPTTNNNSVVEYLDKQTSINDLFLDEYVIVRTYSAGVFAGTLKRKIGNEVELNNARRIWYWKGAASLSQLAEEGTSAPTECQFPAEVSKVLLIGVIEILKVSDKAEKSIKEVPIWKK